MQLLESAERSRGRGISGDGGRSRRCCHCVVRNGYAKKILLTCNDFK